MFWSILWFMLGGLSILHIWRVKKLDEKNPDLSMFKILKLYWKSDRWFILISAIGWIAFTNLLNAGLAKIIVSGVFDYVIDTDNPTGVKFIAFATGLTMQSVIEWISKRKKNSLERALEEVSKKKEIIENKTGEEVSPHAVEKLVEQEIDKP